MIVVSKVHYVSVKKQVFYLVVGTKKELKEKGKKNSKLKINRIYVNALVKDCLNSF